MNNDVKINKYLEELEQLKDEGERRKYNRVLHFMPSFKNKDKDIEYHQARKNFLDDIKKDLIDPYLIEETDQYEQKRVKITQEFKDTLLQMIKKKKDINEKYEALLRKIQSQRHAEEERKKYDALYPKPYIRTRHTEEQSGLNVRYVPPMMKHQTSRW